VLHRDRLCITFALVSVAAAVHADEAPPMAAGELKVFETGIDFQPPAPGTLVTFNLEDADLPELVRLISQTTGRSFIMSNKLRSIRATIYAPTKVTAAEAYQAFLSILELNGMALVPAGRYLKIVEAQHIEGRALPLSVGDGALPSGDRYVTRVQQIKNIAAEDAAKLLEHFKSSEAGLTAYGPTNTLIITDLASNLQRMLGILDQVDIPRTGERTWIEPLHYAAATELAQRLLEVLGEAAPPDKNKPAATVGDANVHVSKLVAEERTNSLIIVATEPAYLRVIAMLRQLDVALEGEGRIHVHSLQHTNAEDLANTLTQLIGKGSPAGKDKAAQPALSAVFEGEVAVTAHKAKNELVIVSSARDYVALKPILERMDSEHQQVFIEAVIMELNVSRSNKLNLAYHGGATDTPESGSLSVLGFNPQATVTGVSGLASLGDLLSGLAFGIQGPSVGANIAGIPIPSFGVALYALAASGDTNVLSTPTLIASDNVEAQITIGQNVPLQTSSAGTLSSLAGLSGLSGAAATNQLSALSGLGTLGSVPRDNVGITVTLTPHINAANEIRLEISEENSSPEAPSSSGNLGVRTINRTTAKTEVVVHDQETAVIGGLMQDTITTAETKIPVLGDIPLLGALFRSHSTNKVKKNLLLFLTPYIIRSRADLKSIYERKLRERQEFIDRYMVANDTAYEVPIDYSRTRGLLGQMLQELRILDEEQRMAAESRAQPVPEHTPSSPVWSPEPNS
jgi:general secretion pathway protein D